MKQLVVLIAIIGFLLFRPYSLGNSTILYSGDDQNYFAHATAIVFGQFPNYEFEHFVWGGKMPLHSIGPGLMAAPFVAVSSLLDRWSGNVVVESRTEQNIRGSWTLFGFVLSSVVYLYLACALIFFALRRFVSDSSATVTVFLCILCQGAPLYAFRRPVYSHIYEFFLQCLLISYLLTVSSGRNSRKEGALGHVEAVGIGIASALVFLVRYNNIAFALVWPLLFSAFFSNSPGMNGKWSKLLLSYGTEFALILGFLIYPWWFNYHAAVDRPAILYGGVGENMVSNLVGSKALLGQKIQSLAHMLFGIDWGLIWTAPFLLIGIFLMIFTKYPKKNYHLYLAIPLLVNLWVALSWIPKWQQGNWYGYRFIIFSAIPISLLPFAIFVEQVLKLRRWSMVGLLCLIGLFPFLAMTLFDGNSSTLTLSENHAINRVYQLNVWKTVLFDFKGCVIALLKGGPLYLVYLFAKMAHLDHRLPGIILERYSETDGRLAVKSAIIYFLAPIAMTVAGCYGLMPKRESSCGG